MDRKEQLRAYKEAPRAMGVYLVRNTAGGTAFIGSSVNIPGMLNRQRFQLEMGGHSNRALQAQWDQVGADAFLFEALDTLEPPTDPDYDPADDLAMLEDMWLERLSLAPVGADAAPAQGAPAAHVAAAAQGSRAAQGAAADRSVSALAPNGVTRISTRNRKPPRC